MPPRRRPRAGAARSGPVSGVMVPMARAASEGPASSGAAPMVHPEKGPAGAGWIQEDLNKKAATASSGGVPTVHPGEGSAGTVSSGEMLDKMAATVGGAQIVHPGKLAAGSGSGSTGDMLQKKADAGSRGGAPMARPRATISCRGRLPSPPKRQRSYAAVVAHAGSTGDILQKKADVASSGGRPITPPSTHPGRGKVVTSSVSSGGMLQKKVAAASCGGMPTILMGKSVVDTDLSQEMPQKKATTLSGDSPTLGALDGNTTAQDCEEPVAKHSIYKALTLSSAKIPQKHCTADKADMGLSGGMLQEQISKVETDAGLGEKMLHENLTKEADTAKNIQELKDAEDLIEKLNELRMGEPINKHDSLDYLHSLARHPPRIDLKVQMTNEELAKQHDRHALCRLRYYKDKLKRDSKGQLCDDKLKNILDISEDDCSKEFIKNERFFRRFEKDKTFDWFFHPDYLCCSLLVDYQRLVLKNHGYSRWSKYHAYLHSYEIEQEYVNYCEELSKQLKWMEPYVDIDHSSVKWDKISSRAALQAIKIAATSFHKISASLAFNAYYECNESMCYDVWFTESNGVYFEIWRRVTEGMSFKKALEEVYNLNRFPVRQSMMKAALDFDETMELMEDEFQASTEDITPEVKEDKAKELIAQAVSRQVKKPKSYEQYIRKKIDIANIIGIL